MNRATALLILMLGSAGALSGCFAAHPFILRGDEKSVDVTYGGDVARAAAVAHQHCAQYGRVERLVDPGYDVATFDCARP